eukprot:4690865-Amphidinium_carterae.1
MISAACSGTWMGESAWTFYTDDISHHYGKALQETCGIGKVRRCATICMGSGGSLWAKPPSPQ